MLRSVEPFQSFFKGFNLFGFDFKHISLSHKFLLIAVSIIATWAVASCFLAIFQSKDVDDFLDRILYTPTLLGNVLKAANIFLHFQQFQKLVGSFSVAFRNKKFKRNFEKALKKAIVFTKTQLAFIVTAVIFSCIATFLGHQLTVPMFLFSTLSDEQQEQMFWVNAVLQNFGTFYWSFLMLICDYTVVSFMIVIAAYFEYLNDSFKALKIDKKLILKSKFIKCIKQHETMKK